MTDQDHAEKFLVRLAGTKSHARGKRTQTAGLGRLRIHPYTEYAIHPETSNVVGGHVNHLRTRDDRRVSPRAQFARHVMTPGKTYGDEGDEDQ